MSRRTHRRRIEVPRRPHRRLHDEHVRLWEEAAEFVVTVDPEDWEPDDLHLMDAHANWCNRWDKESSDG